MPTNSTTQIVGDLLDLGDVRAVGLLYDTMITASRSQNKMIKHGLIILMAKMCVPDLQSITSAQLRALTQTLQLSDLTVDYEYLIAVMWMLERCGGHRELPLITEFTEMYPMPIELSKKPEFLMSAAEKAIIAAHNCQLILWERVKAVAVGDTLLRASTSGCQPSEMLRSVPGEVANKTEEDQLLKPYE